jgi:uncharacterized membrane protein required for colicin V production
LFNFLRQFNWVDIFILVLLYRICYISMANGFVTELFKLLGTVTATFLACHYYHSLLFEFKDKVGSQFFPVNFLDFLTFVLLASAGYLIWTGVRLLFSKAIKTEAAVNFDKWAGLTLGVVRAVLLAGLITCAFMVSSIEYFRAITSSSYFGSRFSHVSPSVYKGIWYGAVSKFMANEKHNAALDSLYSAPEK